MKDIKTICICGGGSLGIVCAGVFLSKGMSVNILTGHPNRWSDTIKVYDVRGNEYGGKLNKVSSIPNEVIPSSDLVLITLPGFLIEDTLQEIKPFLSPNIIVGSIVSSTGFFFAAHKVLGDKHVLFGFQRVPYIARTRKYGEIGDLLGYKNSLNIAIENVDDKMEVVEQLKYLFGTPISLLNNYLEASLTNSNPILHTGRLYSLWKNYNGEVYSVPFLFYAEWTKEASEYLIKMDEEFQTLLRKLNIGENVIPRLLDYYESYDAESLTEKIKSIPAFKDIKAPLKQVANGWVPDFSSRYFTEDFPYGLRLIKELAEKENVKTPYIDEIYNWGNKISQIDFGI